MHRYLTVYLFISIDTNISYKTFSLSIPPTHRIGIGQDNKIGHVEDVIGQDRQDMLRMR